jgi:protein phosphatase
MIEAGFESDKGRVREQNEDACLILPAQQVYVVADGVGGNNSGEYASKMAVSCVADFIRENHLTDIENDSELAFLLRKCVKEVNRTIYQTAKELPESRGMATTLVLCFIRDDRAYFVNIGDSRAYIKRGSSIFQVTEDHSYVNTLLKLGVITREEVKGHARGNIITRAIGAEANVQGDLYQTDLEDGDVILLCTDGLHNELNEEKMTEIIDENKDTVPDAMDKMAEELVKAANDAGGRDNVTVICLMNRRGAQDEQ